MGFENTWQNISWFDKGWGDNFFSCEENLSHLPCDVINIVDGVKKGEDLKPKPFLERYSVDFTWCLTPCFMFSLYPLLEI